MYSIGELSRRTEVKVPTIRYYEDIGLMPPAERSSGNQRRYDRAGLERLSFIRHARDLGFSIEAISSLIVLEETPDRSCLDATRIAERHLAEIRDKIRRLTALEAELQRITGACEGDSAAQDCDILAALADHDLCADAH
ncbi:MerR family transcriptional regulator [Oceanicola sp. 22II-s10i]|uniref:MerR family transcriptional regulator n=1 Tax=Oceanicola sp. 22II-s10i TaxID=1317116 RepID=UPI000B525991|nr:helix-turn-helix domain-containing protein [Oceanicola sp. 22II-s10i]OWU86482.1 MerR family transcriptional regulator [Oceanicola sp. 22II-s10i]